MKHYRTLPQAQVLPSALYRADQVQAMDRRAIAKFGIAGETLMERAGLAAFDALRERWPEARRILVLTGIGNNAGDGFVLARLAHQAGLQVQVVQLGDRERLQADALLNARRFDALSDQWFPFKKTLPEAIDLIVDAVFGTGLQREVSGRWALALEQANRASVPVLSLDIPSGLHADTGQVMGVAVHADLTVSFIALKQGLFTGAGPDYCGEIRFDALQIPAQVYASEILSARLLQWPVLRQKFQPRSRIAHKGWFGHVTVIGGDIGYGGAARLAAEAALRAGAGLVSLATRQAHIGAVLATRPEIMTIAAEPDAGFESWLNRASVRVIGPGLGRESWGRGLWARLAKYPGPKVVDADALNLLAEQPGQSDDWVLTPHPGEAARLLGSTVQAVETDRFAAVRALQQRYGGVIVLKGAGSLIQGPGNRPPAVCLHGNPGMASGGMGDVLSGVIGALLAQGFDAPLAAELGVCLHAVAADKAARAGERGMVASDLFSHIRRLANPDNV